MDKKQKINTVLLEMKVQDLYCRMEIHNKIYIHQLMKIKNDK